MASESEQEKRKMLAEIVAAMRHDAELYHDAWLNDQNENPEADDVSRLLAHYANRIEAAWKRERAEIEAQALSIGGIVESSRHKQKPQGNAAEMREEIVLRLSKKEYKGMQEALAEHDRLCEMVGNAEAMREALEMARDALKSAEKYVYGDPPNGGAIGWDDVWPSEWHNALEAVERALSAPARNCDAMPWRKAWDEWRAKHHPQNPQTFNESYEATVAFMEWFTAPASEKGATA